MHPSSMIWLEWFLLAVDGIIFAAWFLAEFRWRRSVRVSLGLACMLILLYWQWSMARALSQTEGFTRWGLATVTSRLEHGREADALRALKAYEEAYRKTGSSLSAAVAMVNSTLNAVKGEGDIPERGGGDSYCSPLNREPEQTSTRVIPLRQGR